MKPTPIRSKRAEDQQALLNQAMQECAERVVERLAVVILADDKLVLYSDGGSTLELLGMFEAAQYQVHEDCLGESGSEPVA